MDSKQQEFINSLKALLVRYNVAVEKIDIGTDESAFDFIFSDGGEIYILADDLVSKIQQ